MIRLGEQDARIVGITAAMGSGTGINQFAKVFPKRTFDVGIAEEHAVTMAAAMALAGLRPVVAIYSTFLQRAYDQILHDVALQKAPVIFALDRAGLVGDDGPTHHGIFDLAYLRTIPNMVVMAPKDENELGDMMESALRYQLPTAIRFPRGSAVGVEIAEKRKEIPLGKGEILCEGKRVALVAIGAMVQEALKAARLLREKGIEAAVVNARFAKPLDTELLEKLAEEYELLVTMEEGTLCGGFGSGVLEVLNAHKAKCEILRIGIADEFVAQGATEILKAQCGLTAENVCAQVLKWNDEV